MAKKWSEHSVIEAFGGSRHSTALYDSMSDDAWCGWVAAMSLVNHPSSGLSGSEMFALVKQLYADGKLA